MAHDGGVQGYEVVRPKASGWVDEASCLLQSQALGWTWLEAVFGIVRFALEVGISVGQENEGKLMGDQTARMILDYGEVVAECVEGC